MEITHTPYKHCDLVQVKGRIDSFTAPQLGELFTKITDEGRYKIILDMADIEFMSSAGLRALINAQKVCKRYNRGEVILAGIPNNVRAALDLAGFIPLFKVFDDVLTAVGNI